MSKFVLDASVTMRIAVPGPLTQKAKQLQADFENQIHELLAPLIYSGEMASALTKAERQRYIQVGDARKLYLSLLKNPPAFHDIEPMMLDAIDISSRTRCGLYDALYVQLADLENCEFVTADQKCFNNLNPHFSFVRNLATL